MPGEKITTELLDLEFGLEMAAMRTQMLILMLVVVDEKRGWMVGLPEFPDTRVSQIFAASFERGDARKVITRPPMHTHNYVYFRLLPTARRQVLVCRTGWNWAMKRTSNQKSHEIRSTFPWRFSRLSIIGYRYRLCTN